MTAIEKQQTRVKALEAELLSLQEALQEVQQKQAAHEQILLVERATEIRSSNGTTIPATLPAEDVQFELEQSAVRLQAAIAECQSDLRKAIEELHQAETDEAEAKRSAARAEAARLADDVDTLLDILEDKVSALDNTGHKYRRRTPGQGVVDVLNARLLQPFKVSQDSTAGNFTAYMGLDTVNKRNTE